MGKGNEKLHHALWQMNLHIAQKVGNFLTC